MSAPLRYVVLRHEGIPDPHFDLMFETSAGSALATWRSLDWPVQAASVLTALPDHRRTYLDYEGPVSDNRGTVTRVDRGEHAIFESTSAQLVVRLISTDQTITLPRDQT